MSFQPTEPPAPGGELGSEPRPEPGLEPAPEPSFTEQLADQLGGVPGIVESGIPVLVFVIVNVAWTLRPAIVIAVGSALALAIWRLTRRQSVRHALNGLFGIALGAIIAWRTGSAKNFYLPGILLSAAYGVAMLASVAIRMPLIGWLYSVLVTRGSTAWRSDPRLVRTFSWLTVLWAVVYLAKVAIQAVIFHNTAANDPGTALGVARIALGYPPYAALLAFTIWTVRRVTRDDKRAPAHAA